jgi:hypothetical protein
MRLLHVLVSRLGPDFVLDFIGWFHRTSQLFYREPGARKQFLTSYAYRRSAQWLVNPPQRLLLI